MTISTKKSFQLSLLDGISYQDGSVVSKEIFRSPTGRITLFAFAKGQSLSAHSTPFDAFVQVIDGEAVITVSGVTSVVKIGEILYMPANDSHALKAVKPFKMLLTMIKSNDTSK
jgi:quercetin dioxygenase-like cupin family protein